MLAGSAIARHIDDYVAAVTMGSPKIILIVAADHRRQSVWAAEEIDGRGFAVILCDDDCLRFVTGR